MNVARLVLRTGTVLSVVALVACMMACGSRMEKREFRPTKTEKTFVKTAKPLEKTAPDDRKK